MTTQPHLMYLFPSLDLGGGKKGLLAVAKRQLAWARITAAAKSGRQGEREGHYRQAGIAIERNLADLPTLQRWLDRDRPDLVLMHRVGGSNDSDTAILRTLRQAGVATFEVNIFARFDPSTEGLWTGQFHVTRWAMAQYAQRRGSDPFQLPRHLPLGYGLDFSPVVTPEQRRQARAVLGVPEDAFVAVRLVQPNLRKWDPMPVLAFKQLHARGVPAHLLVRQAPGENVNWIRRQIGERAHLLPLTTDEGEYQQTIAAADCLINYSAIGESFGMAIAEGMAAGLPVVTNSQPSLDNAQIEHCVHQQTGLVANTVTGLADSLQRLAEDPELRQRLGQKAREYVESSYDAGRVEHRMRRFFLDSLQQEHAELARRIPVPPTEEDPYQFTPEWWEDFRRREQEPFAREAADGWGDRLALKSIQFQNQLRYAQRLGWWSTAQVLWRRLARGRLTR